MLIQRFPFQKGQSIILIFLLIIVFGLLIVIGQCRRSNVAGPDATVSGVGPVGDTIDVAVEFSPLSYYVSGDSILGLDYELIKSIAEMSGRYLRFHVIPSLDSASEGIADGMYDLVISSLPSTQSLKETWRLSEPVYLDREVLVQLKDSLHFISDAGQLANDTVWIVAGSPFIQRIQNLSSEIGEPIAVESPQGFSAEQLVAKVARGEIPRVVVNEGIARQLQASRYPDIDFSTPVSFNQFQCWIVSDVNPAFADSLNIWLTRFKETEDYQLILSKYGF